MRHLISHAQSHKGLVRKINEDACLDLTDKAVWLVADGMGGHAAGDVASKIVVTEVFSDLKFESAVAIRPGMKGGS